MTSLRQKLKEETRAIHDEAEDNAWSKTLMSKDITRDDYIRILTCFFGYQAMVEKLYQENKFPIELETKLKFLKQDLECLGVDHNKLELAPSPKLAPSEPNKFIGLSYVYLGQSLGSKFIAKSIQAALGFDASNGNAFFSSNNNDWSNFLEFLEKNDFSKDDQEAVVTEAKEAFLQFNKWMQQEWNKAQKALQA